ncbi:MAG: hypothetical protein AMXMBFR58_26920 [Phycisphaerae bacterium]|nr:hypothetical protein [Phycisphaerales bacterium]MCK6475357.1 FHA domain-containing protein [Phycisphaerales bacterium]
MDFSLVLVTADFNKRLVPIARSRTVIGRATECNIRIPSGDVSRQHCELLVDGQTLRIKDLGSSNGTFVNRKRVTEAELHAGDLISVGNVVCAVRIGGKPPDVDAEDTYEDGIVATTATGSGRPAEAPTTVSSRAPAPVSSVTDDDDEDDEDANDDSDSFDFDFSDDDDEKKPGKK